MIKWWNLMITWVYVFSLKCPVWLQHISVYVCVCVCEIICGIISVVVDYLKDLKYHLKFNDWKRDLKIYSVRFRENSPCYRWPSLKLEGKSVFFFFLKKVLGYRMELWFPENKLSTVKRVTGFCANMLPFPYCPNGLPGRQHAVIQVI